MCLQAWHDTFTLISFIILQKLLAELFAAKADN